MKMQQILKRGASYEYIGSHSKEIYSTQFKARTDEKCYLLIKHNRDIIITQKDGSAHDTLFLKGKIAKNARISFNNCKQKTEPPKEALFDGKWMYLTITKTAF